MSKPFGHIFSECSTWNIGHASANCLFHYSNKQVILLIKPFFVQVDLCKTDLADRYARPLKREAAPMFHVEHGGGFPFKPIHLLKISPTKATSP
jgi:hypothetical protein